MKLLLKQLRPQCSLHYYKFKLDFDMLWTGWSRAAWCTACGWGATVHASFQQYLDGEQARTGQWWTRCHVLARRHNVFHCRFCRWSVIAAPCFSPKCYIVLCCVWQIVSLWVWRETDNKLSGKWWRNLCKKGKRGFPSIRFWKNQKNKAQRELSTVNITLLKHCVPFEIQLITISLLFPTPSSFIYSYSILMAFLGIEILAYGSFSCISQSLFSSSISIQYMVSCRHEIFSLDEKIC